MKRCLNCGADNKDSDMFCQKCGYSLNNPSEGYSVGLSDKDIVQQTKNFKKLVVILILVIFAVIIFLLLY